ncbi:MAG: septum formation initiator family protein [Jatrophihabitans sp.]
MSRARPVLTGRALGLGALVVLLVVVLASPVHRYLASRSDVTSAARQLHEDRQQLAELTKQKALYSDPGFIQQQARKRLSFAMPGDTVFVVVDKGSKTEIEKTRDKSTAGKVTGPWNDRLWNSVRAAGR